MAVDLSSSQFLQPTERQPCATLRYQPQLPPTVVGAHLHRNHYRFQAADGPYFGGERGLVGGKDANPCGSSVTAAAATAAPLAAPQKVRSFQCTLCGKRFKVMQDLANILTSQVYGFEDENLFAMLVI
jgi:hypothetical protein